MLAVASRSIEGHADRGFEAVRDAFEENFARRGELGRACCVYYRGEKVVDLWGGIRNKQNRPAMGKGHHGARLLGHQGSGCHDARHGALARLAR